ncbi:MAG: glycosyltransferase family 4 protein [Bacteroidia bacterium]|nr:glycosyltransferase family 4 protein [Bacteroidia bacterium]
MKSPAKKKLLLVGTGVVHTFKYLELIASFFDEILLVTDQVREGLEQKQLRFDFSLRSAHTIPSRIKTLRKIIDDFNPDIVHIHQAGSGAWFTLQACRKQYPTVVTAWGSDILHTPSKGFLYRRMIKYILRNADCFTSDAIFMANEMRRMAGSRPLDILIANFGIDILPQSHEKENLVYSNRQLTPLYRIDKVIELFCAFVQSSPEYSTWKLAIAATGSEESRLKQLAEDSGIDEQIRFYGWVDKALNSELYGRAKVYISIPESDATSISLLEAMASACVPVVSDLPANREWIRDGVNGILYRPGDDDCIRKAVQLNGEALREMNREIIEREGTKSANRQKFIGLYERILHGD